MLLQPSLVNSFLIIITFLCVFGCFTVQAEDSGTPSLSGTATVLFFILDDNDNTPEFSQPDFHIVIPENLPPGVIHIIQASDVDNGLNGTIQYSIEGK